MSYLGSAFLFLRFFIDTYLIKADLVDCKVFLEDYTDLLELKSDGLPTKLCLSEDLFRVLLNLYGVLEFL